MKEIVKLVMDSMDYTSEEAIEAILNCQELLLECEPAEGDDIIMEELGLEPDYITDIIFF